MKLLLCSVFALIVPFVLAGKVPSLLVKAKDEIIQRITDQHIVGGNAVPIWKHPHQVNIRIKRAERPSNPFTHHCGGSIYSDRIIITAAHCVHNKVATEFHVVAGSTHREGNDGHMVPVEEIVEHEGFNPSSFENDIAILVLGASLPLNDFDVKAIQLADSDDYSRPGQMGVVSGWGSLKFLGSYPDLLQDVQLPIVSNELCAQDNKQEIFDSMMCAGYRGVGGKDACQGDSGGPFIVNGKLTGVVSNGKGCARKNYPGVYTKISALHPWIMDKIRKANENRNVIE